MVRGLTATTMLLAVGIDSTLAEPDLLRYAMTQGGLLLVVIVILWSYRRDFTRIQKRDDDKVAVLTELVAKNITALERTGAATVALTKVIEEDRRYLIRREADRRDGQ